MSFVDFAWEDAERLKADKQYFMDPRRNTWQYLRQALGLIQRSDQHADGWPALNGVGGLRTLLCDRAFPASCQVSWCH